MGSQMAQHTKEQLVELIEAYAVAKGTTNAALTSLAAGALQQILVAVTFVDSPPETVPDDFAAPEDVTTPVRRIRKGGIE